MNNLQQPQNQAPGGPQQPGQMMQQAPYGQQARGFPPMQQQQHNAGMAAQQQQMNPQMFMQQQQMVAQNQPPHQNFYNQNQPQRGNTGTQYRQKQQPQGFVQQQQPNPHVNQNRNPQMKQQYGAGMPGGFPMSNVMNAGIGPGGPGYNSFPFATNNGTGSPQVKRERGPQFSLYIGNLSNNTFDLDLYKYFTSRGFKLQGAKVMFDKETHRSKGFGYLNFNDTEEQERCLKEMNNAVIDGKQVVLNKKKDSEFDNKANLVVRNLPKEMNQKELNVLFSQYGQIGSCKLEVFKDGISRCFGYVQYMDQESAQSAIQALHGSTQGDKKIEVIVHSKKDEREQQGDKYTNLFVRNLPADYTEAQLTELFGQYGQINSATIQPKGGAGFVSYKDHESARKAIEETNMKLKINGTTILVSPHVYKKESDLPKNSSSNPIVQNQKEMFKSNIYVKFIPKGISQQEVEEKFSQAGNILSIKLKDYEVNYNGEKFTSYQIGYVLYEDVKQAQKCIQLFDQSRCFSYNQKPLKVDFWQAKDELVQARYEKQRNYVTQLINFVKNQSKQGQGIGQGGFQMGGPQQQQYNNQMQPGQMGGDNQNQRGGMRGGRGMRGRGRGGPNNRGNSQHWNKNNQNPGHQQRPNKPMGQNMMQNQQMAAGNQPQNMMPQQQPQMMNVQNAQQQMMMQQQALRLPQINVDDLDNLQGDERNNFVGNNIYMPIMQAFGEEFAPTITGMLLDESAVDFKLLLTQNQYFVSKAREAYDLLVQSKQQQQQVEMQQNAQQINQ